ncbi:MAG: DUF5915 domain-containing protein, partial [Saprospiraceae bacterium]|nr:DUF5915 domain-containing protein [Saprospiraceae bacterium]
GRKMSKRLGNAVDPFETIATYGADATRWYMMSNAQPWDNLKFDQAGIVEIQRKLFGTLYNTYSFFALYANIDGFEMDEMEVTPVDARPEIDRWIISRLNSLVAEYRRWMDDYEPTQACRAIETFVSDHLSNWYVRLNRRRFWKGEMSEDKQMAYETLFQCLLVTGQLMAPVAPIFADWLYRNLTDVIRQKAIANNTPLHHLSVHLTDLTPVEEDHIDTDLEQRMDYAQRIASLVLSLRKKERIRVRQPLPRILLPVLDSHFQEQVEAVRDLILSETNVKEIEYVTDTSGIIKKKAKPNFKTLGRRLGKDMKAGTAIIQGLDDTAIAEIERTNAFELAINGTTYDLTLEDIEIVTEDIPGWLVASDGMLTVALDIHIDDALEAEGFARDLVNRIQNLRKDKDFNVTDHIVVTVERQPDVDKAIASFADYVKTETLARRLESANSVDGDPIEWIDGSVLKIRVELHR